MHLIMRQMVLQRDRLNADPAINGCSEQGYTYGPECLAAYVQSSGAIPMPVERAVYGWIYEDSSSAWGHRNTCFAFFNNDFGLSSNEGFIGVGLATGGPWSGFGRFMGKCSNRCF